MYSCIEAYCSAHCNLYDLCDLCERCDLFVRFTTTRTPACCKSSADRGTGTSFCEPLDLPAGRLHACVSLLGDYINFARRFPQL